MKMIKIAVTGGIGSGKSTVLKIISDLGYQTVSLDEVYEELLKDEKFVLKISNAMSVEPIYEDGKACLDRKGVSQKVFCDKYLLNKLNALTHSAIFEKAFKNQTQNIAFYEVPLLFEGNYQSLFDKVIVVIRNKELRIESAMQRDNASQNYVVNKINNQFDYDNSDLSLHTIIENNSNLEELTNKVVRAIKSIEKEFI